MWSWNALMCKRVLLTCVGSHVSLEMWRLEVVFATSWMVAFIHATTGVHTWWRLFVLLLCCCEQDDTRWRTEFRILLGLWCQHNVCYRCLWRCRHLLGSGSCHRNECPARQYHSLGGVFLRTLLYVIGGAGNRHQREDWAGWWYSNSQFWSNGYWRIVLTNTGSECMMREIHLRSKDTLSILWRWRYWWHGWRWSRYSVCALVWGSDALSVCVLAVHKDQLLLCAHLVFEALQNVPLIWIWGCCSLINTCSTIFLDYSRLLPRLFLATFLALMMTLFLCVNFPSIRWECAIFIDFHDNRNWHASHRYNRVWAGCSWGSAGKWQLWTDIY